MGVRGIAADVSARVEAAPEEVYELFREIDVTTILTGLGPLPAVSSVTNPSGYWADPGQERTLHLADGSSLRERMTAVDAPRSFSYELDQLSGPLGSLVRGASGRWSFARLGDAPSATRAAWHYVFYPHSWLTWLPSVLIVKCLWRPYMGLVLGRAAAQVADGGRDG